MQLKKIGEKIRRFVFKKFVKTCGDLYNSLLDDDGPVSSGYDTYDSTAIASAMNGTPGMKRIDEN